MRKLRAVLPNGEVVVGVEVFRQTYEAIGLGWVFQATKLPIIGQMADSLYDFWAENRLRITGRQELADQLRERATLLADADEGTISYFQFTFIFHTCSYLIITSASLLSSIM